MADFTTFAIRIFFNLYFISVQLDTTPPKKILPLEETLVNAGCVPCAKLYFAYNQNSNTDVGNQGFLHDKVKPFVTSQTVASRAAGYIR